MNTQQEYWLEIQTSQWFSDCSAQLLQSCPTLWDPIDGSPPGSPVPGILQARTLEWVAISFSNAWKWKVKAKSLSRVRPSATPWTAAHQAPPPMEFSRQEHWSGVPLRPTFFLHCPSVRFFFMHLLYILSSSYNLHFILGPSDFLTDWYWFVYTEIHSWHYKVLCVLKNT